MVLGGARCLRVNARGGYSQGAARLMTLFLCLHINDCAGPRTGRGPALRLCNTFLIREYNFSVNSMHKWEVRGYMHKGKSMRQMLHYSVHVWEALSVECRFVYVRRAWHNNAWKIEMCETINTNSVHWFAQIVGKYRPDRGWQHMARTFRDIINSSGIDIWQCATNSYFIYVMIV